MKDKADENNHMTARFIKYKPFIGTIDGLLLLKMSIWQTRNPKRFWQQDIQTDAKKGEIILLAKQASDNTRGIFL